MKTVPNERIAPTKAAMAAWFGVSPQAVDGWLRRGCPRLSPVGKAGPIRFDLMEVCRWKFGAQQHETSTAAGKLDPQHERARLDAARADIEQVKLGKIRGELVEAAEFERALAEPLKLVAMTLEGLPDHLERVVGIGPEVVEAIVAALDNVRENVYQRMIATTAARE
jgi:phage terminase Nu1 subunit (DNA packaging protein)